MKINLLMRKKKQFLTFVAVGAICTLVNLVMLFFLVDIINLDKKIIAPSIALEFSIVVSFILNDNITFRKSKNEKILKRISKFHLAALSGFLLNLIIYNILLKYGGLALLLGNMDYIASQMVAVFIVVFWNYFVNSRWTWAG